MKVLSLLIALMLVGCDLDPYRTDWEHAIAAYKCTDEQMAKVERETKQALSLTNTERYATYWYGNAILRNCDKRSWSVSRKDNAQ